MSLSAPALGRPRAAAAWRSRVVDGALPLSLLLVGCAAAVLVATVALRVYALDRVGLNSDEAVYSGQAAALFGDSTLSQFFSLFRAHPLLLQLLVGALFQFVGVSDLSARLLVALGFGMGSVILTGLLAKELYGPRVGLVAAAILATMPYHVVVSRQVLVDVPMAFFVLLALLAVAKGSKTRSGAWLVVAWAATGAAVLSKETGVLILPALGLFFYWSGRWRYQSRRAMLLGFALFAMIVAPFVLTRLISPLNASSFVLWQFARPPNNDPDYFIRVLWEYASLPVLAASIAGAVLMARRRRVTDMLTLCWLGVFLLFFMSWPTKLFPYLMVVAPGIAICAAVGLEQVLKRLARTLPALKDPGAQATAFAAGVALLVLYLGSNSLSLVSSGHQVHSAPLDMKVEVQDFAGAREFSHWVRSNTSPDARFLTIGPSLGNILRFYGQRDSVALSVSPNPERRNPAYLPLPNPDLALRSSSVHYVVWDAYSAARSTFYSDRLSHYVAKYNGSVAHAVYVDDQGALQQGSVLPAGAEPRIVVYDVVGGDPLDNPGVNLAESEADDEVLARGPQPIGGDQSEPAVDQQVSFEPGNDQSERIDNIVVIIQQNHTFDSYFGTYPGANGFDEVNNFPLLPQSRERLSPILFNEVLARRMAPPPGDEQLSNSSAAARAAYNAGTMDGFLRAQANRGFPAELPVVYHNRATAGGLWSVADQFVLFDNYFSSTFGGSLTNLLYLVAGDPHGVAPGTKDALAKLATADFETVFDQLQDAGVSWKFYIGPIDEIEGEAVLGGDYLDPSIATPSPLYWAPILAMDRFWLNPALHENLAGQEQFYADASSGGLPSVSFVLPTLTDHPLTNTKVG
ncbi:MAG: phospholipid carrier-dependent glycosyltransferase, partial [Dehalococcoidia bacterium]|nr:phospholipid carrier-dependent glycosyltransferase [Dehalococcoidia bacterium]